MDANKAKKLRTINYKILPICRRCKYANIGAATAWGTCDKHTYYHLKHQETRQLSIHVSGSCDNFKPTKWEDIHGFTEFITCEPVI